MHTILRLPAFCLCEMNPATCPLLLLLASTNIHQISSLHSIPCPEAWTIRTWGIRTACHCPAASQPQRRGTTQSRCLTPNLPPLDFGAPLLHPHRWRQSLPPPPHTHTPVPISGRPRQALKDYNCTQTQVGGARQAPFWLPSTPTFV